MQLDETLSQMARELDYVRTLKYQVEKYISSLGGQLVFHQTNSIFPGHYVLLAHLKHEDEDHCFSSMKALPQGLKEILLSIKKMVGCDATDRPLNNSRHMTNMARFRDEAAVPEQMCRGRNLEEQMCGRNVDDLQSFIQPAEPLNNAGSCYQPIEFSSLSVPMPSPPVTMGMGSSLSSEHDECRGSLTLPEHSECQGAVISLPPWSPHSDNEALARTLGRLPQGL
jgi:hypothetical protein